MKQLIWLIVLISSFVPANAQTDSVLYKVSVHEEPLRTSLSKEKLVENMNKQKSVFDNSVYYISRYLKNSGQYRYPVMNAVQNTSVGIVGNVLLSILAGKTNHGYRSAPF